MGASRSCRRPSAEASAGPSLLPKLVRPIRADPGRSPIIRRIPRQSSSDHVPFADTAECARSSPDTPGSWDQGPGGPVDRRPMAGALADGGGRPMGLRNGIEQSGRGASIRLLNGAVVEGVSCRSIALSSWPRRVFTVGMRRRVCLMLRPATLRSAVVRRLRRLRRGPTPRLYATPVAVAPITVGCGGCGGCGGCRRRATPVALVPVAVAAGAAAARRLRRLRPSVLCAAPSYAPAGALRGEPGARLYRRRASWCRIAPTRRRRATRRMPYYPHLVWRPSLLRRPQSRRDYASRPYYG